MNSTSSSGFLKAAACCALASAITTFLLWLLPRMYEAPANFEASISLASNPYYLALKWVNLLHIPLALFAYTGLAVLLFRKAPAKTVFAMLWFGIWGAIEMIGMAITLFSVNFWRRSYTSADDATKLTLQKHIDFFSSIWNSMFFVLLIAFLLGTIFFALATWKGKGLEKILSYLFWLAVPLTLLIMLNGYAEQQWAGQITGYIYPVLQPISRALMGVYIFMGIRNKESGI